MKQEKISIDDDVHKSLKDFCNKNGLKMGAFVSRIIRERLQNDTKNNEATREDK